VQRKTDLQAGSLHVVRQSRLLPLLIVLQQPQRAPLLLLHDSSTGCRISVSHRGHKLPIPLLLLLVVLQQPQRTPLRLLHQAAERMRSRTQDEMTTHSPQSLRPSGSCQTDAIQNHMPWSCVTNRRITKQCSQSHALKYMNSMKTATDLEPAALLRLGGLLRAAGGGRLGGAFLVLLLLLQVLFRPGKETAIGPQVLIMIILMTSDTLLCGGRLGGALLILLLLLQVLFVTKEHFSYSPVRGDRDDLGVRLWQEIGGGTLLILLLLEILIFQARNLLGILTDCLKRSKGKGYQDLDPTC